MNLQRQLLFWIGALLVLVLLLWLLSDVLLPFVAGIAIAYFLDPVADRLERLGLPRWAATTLILMGFVLAIVVAVIALVPLLREEVAGFVERVPSYTARLQQIFTDLKGSWIGNLVGRRLPDIQKAMSDSLGEGVSFVTGFLTSLWSGGQAVFGVFSIVLVTPVVAFYMLLDWEVMVRKVDAWLPRDHAPVIRSIVRDIDRAIAGFIRGQALVCLFLGLFYGTGLTLIGVNFGFLIGVVAGFISFIPYLGSILGFVIAIVVALVQSWPDWHLPVFVAAVFGVGQFIEGNILSPRLVGSSVGLHPVWLMFALLAAGSLFGFLGLLVAVPVAAAIGVLARFAIDRYLASPLYTGIEPGPPVGEGGP